MITDINIGVCQARVQQNEPAFFVNWMENGENNYKFFSMRFACEDFKNRLQKIQRTAP